MSSDEQGASTVRTLWEAMDARDWDRVASVLHDDVEVVWPQSGEVVRGSKAFVALNQRYPGQWRLHVEEVVAHDDRVAARVRIPIDGRVEWCVGFYEVRDGRIVRGTEVWGEPFAPAPWRENLVERPEDAGGTGGATGKAGPTG